MKTTTEKQKHYENSFQACGHRIEFYFDLDGVEVTEEIEERLKEEAEFRARDQLALDFVEGELNCTIPNEDGSLESEREFSGYWQIAGRN